MEGGGRGGVDWIREEKHSREERENRRVMQEAFGSNVIKSRECKKQEIEKDEEEEKNKVRKWAQMKS